LKKTLFCIVLAGLLTAAKSQSLEQIKKVLDTTSNPVGFVKFVLKKKYFIDTIAVLSTSHFLGKADSLAYWGKVGKVYGPFKKDNILVKVLMKAPNTFYHVRHILLDTSLYRPRYAESLADTIMSRIRSGGKSFAEEAGLYSGDYASARNGGDLGWFVRGVMLPQMDAELDRHKKGDLFKIWSKSGLHIVSIADDPKKDNGYALLLRVIL
jgi:parvulin-like peptidyl-prolyl isomerase